MCLTFPTVNQRENHNEFNFNKGEKAKYYSHGILNKEFSKMCKHLVLAEYFNVGGTLGGNQEGKCTQTLKALRLSRYKRPHIQSI